MREQSLFGVCCRFWRRKGHWFWRANVWVRKRRAVGPYPSRQAAIKDAVRLLYSNPALKGPRS